MQWRPQIIDMLVCDGVRLKKAVALARQPLNLNARMRVQRKRLSTITYDQTRGGY